MSTIILKIHSLYEYFVFLGSFVYRNTETINRNIIEMVIVSPLSKKSIADALGAIYFR